MAESFKKFEFQFYVDSDEEIEIDLIDEIDLSNRKVKKNLLSKMAKGVPPKTLIQHEFFSCLKHKMDDSFIQQSLFSPVFNPIPKIYKSLIFSPKKIIMEKIDDSETETESDNSDLEIDLSDEDDSLEIDISLEIDLSSDDELSIAETFEKLTIDEKIETLDATPKNIPIPEELAPKSVILKKKRRCSKSLLTPIKPLNSSSAFNSKRQFTKKVGTN